MPKAGRCTGWAVGLRLVRDDTEVEAEHAGSADVWTVNKAKKAAAKSNRMSLKSRPERPWRPPCLSSATESLLLGSDLGILSGCLLCGLVRVSAT